MLRLELEQGNINWPGGIEQQLRRARLVIVQPHSDTITAL
jgi:hypothetical protein